MTPEEIEHIDREHARTYERERVKIGISAPPNVTIVRDELLEPSLPLPIPRIIHD